MQFEILQITWKNEFMNIRLLLSFQFLIIISYILMFCCFVFSYGLQDFKNVNRKGSCTELTLRKRLSKGLFSSLCPSSDQISISFNKLPCFYSRHSNPRPLMLLLKPKFYSEKWDVSIRMTNWLLWGGFWLGCQSNPAWVNIIRYIFESN